MKRLLLAPLLLLITSCQSIDYEQCEAIQSVITRNNIQRELAIEEAYRDFQELKVQEALEEYGYIDCDEEYGLCDSVRANAYEYSDWGDYLNQRLIKYQKVDEKAQKDFKKRGCL